MFGLEIAEILVILVVALLVFGPDRVPEMTKQLAAWVRDLRQLVANARRDLNVSAADLGLDEEDVRTLRSLRNPKAFVKDRVLDGVEFDDLDLEKVAKEDDAPSSPAKGNGSAAKGSVDTPKPVVYDPDAT